MVEDGRIVADWLDEHVIFYTRDRDDASAEKAPSQGIEQTALRGPEHRDELALDRPKAPAA
jgi:hypothetical protein